MSKLLEHIRIENTGERFMGRVQLKLDYMVQDTVEIDAPNELLGYRFSFAMKYESRLSDPDMLPRLKKNVRQQLARDIYGDLIDDLLELERMIEEEREEYELYSKIRGIIQMTLDEGYDPTLDKPADILEA